jgi:hypothetical protein
MNAAIRFSGLVALGALASACASKPAAPFDTLKNAQVTALWLQNYEPPEQAQAAPEPQQPGMAVPGLPPEIQQWAQQALPGLQQLLPPGLIPPGMLEGMQQPQQQAAPPPQQAAAPRFPMSPPNFRILTQTPVMDPELKEQLAELLGDEDNFQAEHNNCLYAEMGLSWSPAPGAPPNDLLVSYSCNRVEARGFAWPHPYRGMKPDTHKELAGIVQKLWPPGT